MEPACRRCKADLALMVALEARRATMLAGAARCVQAGDGDGAVRAARGAHALRPGADSWRMIAVGQLLRRDYPQALRTRYDAMGINS